jgi:hypothetical protein
MIILLYDYISFITSVSIFVLSNNHLVVKDNINNKDEIINQNNNDEGIMNNDESILFTDLISMKKKSIRRSNSEYSLGLSRTSSFANNLNDLGPLCNGGDIYEYIDLGLKITCMVAISGMVYIYKSSNR